MDSGKLYRWVVPVTHQPFEGYIGIVRFYSSSEERSVFVEFGPRAGAMWYRESELTWLRDDALSKQATIAEQFMRRVDA